MENFFPAVFENNLDWYVLPPTKKLPQQSIHWKQNLVMKPTNQKTNNSYKRIYKSMESLLEMLKYSRRPEDNSDRCNAISKKCLVASFVSLEGRMFVLQLWIMCGTLFATFAKVLNPKTNGLFHGWHNGPLVRGRRSLLRTEQCRSIVTGIRIIVQLEISHHWFH